jgi:hypothetical protein
LHTWQRIVDSGRCRHVPRDPQSTRRLCGKCRCKPSPRRNSLLARRTRWRRQARRRGKARQTTGILWPYSSPLHQLRRFLKAITTAGWAKSTLACEGRLGAILAAPPVLGLDRRPVLLEAL